MTPATIFDAIQEGDIESVRRMVRENPVVVNTRNTTGDSPLLFAAYRSQADIVAFLLESEVPLSLHEAAATGRVDQVFQHLQREPGLVRSHSHDGWTPLHLAAFFGHPGAARVLLDAGADTAAVSANELAVTPLHAALAGGRAEVAAVLIERGADVNVQAAGSGLTPLHYAAAGGLVEIARTLLAKGARADVRSTDGKTPLDLALEKGQSAVAMLLGGR